MALTDEQRAARSERARQNWKRPEYRASIIASLKASERTPDQRAASRTWRLAYWTPERRAARKQLWTAEKRAELSAAILGYVVPPEYHLWHRKMRVAGFSRAQCAAAIAQAIAESPAVSQSVSGSSSNPSVLSQGGR